MKMEEILLNEFLKRIDLDTVCKDDEILARAIEKILGNKIDSKRFVKTLKEKYFDNLYKQFIETLSSAQDEKTEQPKSVEAQPDYTDDILLAIYFIDATTKKPATYSLLEQILPKLDVPVDNLTLTNTIQKLEREHLIELKNEEIIITEYAKQKIHSNYTSAKIHEWKKKITTDPSLKQLLAEHKKKITTLDSIS